MGDPAVVMPMNGPLSNPEVVGALERLLADARAGKILSIGVVIVPGPGGITCMATNGCAAELYTGCGMLQSGLMAAMSGKPSSILRPGHG